MASRCGWATRGKRRATPLYWAPSTAADTCRAQVLGRLSSEIARVLTGTSSRRLFPEPGAPLTPCAVVPRQAQAPLRPVGDDGRLRHRDQLQGYRRAIPRHSLSQHHSSLTDRVSCGVAGHGAKAGAEALPQTQRVRLPPSSPSSFRPLGRRSRLTRARFFQVDRESQGDDIQGPRTEETKRGDSPPLPVGYVVSKH